MATRIMDVAEGAARREGWDGFSFRRLADAVGIKSASVHYHFPNKEALGVALTDRYTDRFLGSLGSPEEAGALKRAVEGFRSALGPDGGMCLCGLFAAEIEGLPEDVRGSVRNFFVRLRAWLEAAYAAAGSVRPGEQASVAISLLEGGLLVARALGDHEHFERSAVQVMSVDGALDPAVGGA
ncbi:MAG: TetR/AcrR family transcriptional regulator [Myxococcota bacterium]